jgi:Ca2+/Na+ antiporter
MFNKNYLFIFISILLAFIISTFYNKNMDITFLMMFIILSLFFYIVFYYLGSTRESYSDYNRFYKNNYHSYDNLNNHILRNTLEESEHIEEEIHQKEYKYNPPKKYLETQQVEEETSNSNPQQIKEEEENNIPYNEIVKPDINKIFLENPISKTASPLNINISYNSQNSINELDNNEKKNDKDCKYSNDNNNNNNNNNNNKNNNNKNNSKNLGSYCDNSRVYNNSDWIYGSNAWSNDPDYYIPNKGCSNKYEKDNNCITEVPQPLNELINTRKYKENKNVCPLMINTPWTEYKTGDSEPEPYNL